MRPVIINKKKLEEDELSLVEMWPKMKEWLNELGTKGKIKDWQVFEDGSEIKFSESLSQADRKLILEPDNWKCRQWVEAGTYALDLLKATQNMATLWDLGRDDDDVPPPQKKIKNTIAEQFYLAQILSKKASKKNEFWQVSHQIPFCWLKTNEGKEIICWRFNPDWWYSNLFNTKTQKIRLYQQLSEVLMKDTRGWEKFFENCRARWHKPRLSAENFSRAWAPILWREGVERWQHLLLDQGLKADETAMAFNLRRWGQNGKILLEFITFNYNYLQPLTKIQQKEFKLLLNKQKEEKVAEELEMMMQTDYLNCLQLELYVNLLADRGEFKKDWMWGEEDEE